MKYVLPILAGIFVAVGIASAQFNTFTIPSPWILTQNGLAVRLLKTSTSSPSVVIGEQATSTVGNLFEVNGNGYISNTFQAANVIATSSVITQNLTVNGTCTGCGTVSLTGGNINAITYWPTATTIAATSTLAINALYATSTTATNEIAGTLLTALSGGKLGVGTSSAGSLLSVHGPALIVGTTTSMGGVLTPSISATGTLGFYTTNFTLPSVVLAPNGNFGVGTTTPGSLLSVHGAMLINATSTFLSGLLAPLFSATTSIGFYPNSTTTPFMLVGTSLAGIGTSSPGWPFSLGVNTVIAGAQFAQTIASGTAAATQNINWNKGNTQRIILTANTDILIDATSSNPIDGGKYILKLCQDNIGSRTVSFSGSSHVLRWWNGTTTISSGASTCSHIGMIYDATTKRYDVIASSTGTLYQ